jgi:hypothetical protein
MIKSRKMRRKIPVLKISMEEGSDYSQLMEIPEVQKVVIEETVYAIKDGMAKNKKIISLFEVANTNCYIDLEKNKWKSTLEHTIEYFVEKEDYNKCIEIRNLIDKL